MPRRLRLACFGLPLAPYLLARDAHDVELAVLSPVAAPGRRRLRALLGAERVLEATALGGRLGALVEQVLARDPPDLVVSWFWTRRLPGAWLERARLGGIGVHPSLLPRHRGPNPYFWAIDAGDAVTGVSVHRLTERYDDGPVLLQEELRIGQRDAWQLARALDRPSLRLLRRAVASFAAGTPPDATSQDESAASWAPEPEGDALRVDFRWPSDRVLRRIRALSPVPGALWDVEGLSLVVLRARETSDYPRALLPGEAAVFGAVSHLVVRTGTGALALEQAMLDRDGGVGPVLDGLALARVVAEHLAARRGDREPGW